MRITRGNTRTVILTDKYAIKFARFGILRLLRKLVRACLDPQWRAEKIELMSDPKNESLIPKVRRMFFHGHRANQQEHELWSAHPELPLAPVLGLYLGGFVLIMARGQDVPHDVSASFRDRFGDQGDLGRACQVCMFSDGLRYVDYGHPTAVAVLTVS